MNNTTPRSLSLTLALWVVACGPVATTPPNDDAGTDSAAVDSAAPSACATPRVLLEDDSQRFAQVAYERVPGGYIEVSARNDGAVSARLFDAEWNARPAPTLLGSLPSADPSVRRRLSVAFLDGRGAISIGSTVWDVTVDPSLALRINRTLPLAEPRDGDSLIGAWPLASPGNEVMIYAVTTDGTRWIAGIDRSSLARINFYGIDRDPLALDSSVAFVYGRSTSHVLQTVHRRAVNNLVRVRSLWIARGQLMIGTDRTEEGTMVSPLARVGDALWRLHRLRTTDGDRLSLVAHDPRDATTVSNTALAETGFVFSGAVAESTNAAATLLAWVRSGGDDSQPNVVVAQRDAAAPREIFRSMRATSLLGAWVDERTNRRWVSFATFSSEAAPRTATWYAQCVQ